MPRNGRVIKNYVLRNLLDQVTYRYRQGDELSEWLKAGQPLPPPQLVKQGIVRAYAKQFGLHVFIETGTYLGDMTCAIQDVFDEIYSIELGQHLYERAKRRFAGKHHITILHGDSARLLPIVLDHVKQPCLFWLDAHWSGAITVKDRTNTPIEMELHHILQHPIKRHVILIDDAHCFTGQDDFPTLQELRDLMASTRTYADFEVRYDMIAISQNRIPSEIPICRKTPDLLVLEALGHAYHATTFPSMALGLILRKRHSRDVNARFR